MESIVPVQYRGKSGKFVSCERLIPDIEYITSHQIMIIDDILLNVVVFRKKLIWMKLLILIVFILRVNVRK